MPHHHVVDRTMSMVGRAAAVKGVAGRRPRVVSSAAAAAPLSVARFSSSRAAVIIPARRGSTRFPGEGARSRGVRD